MNLESLIESLKEKNTEYNLAKKEYKLSKSKLSQIQGQLEVISESKQIILETGKQSQDSIRAYIENTVSQILKAVYGDNYQFSIEITDKRDQQEIKFFVVKDDVKLEPRDDLFGGGVHDICSFGLRLAVWTLEGDAPPIMFLDEPFKNLDKEGSQLVFNILKDISKQLDMQFVIITHIEELEAIGGKIIRIEAKP